VAHVEHSFQFTALLQLHLGFESVAVDAQVLVHLALDQGLVLDLLRLELAQQTFQVNVTAHDEVLQFSCYQERYGLFVTLFTF